MKDTKKPAVKRHPNVLWIMTDQHRADCMGYMSGGRVQTPNLDRLAADGIVFENAFCQSPVCMASRASLFTGRYPAAIRVRGMGILPPSETTTPELFQLNGYCTGAFGKVHLTPEVYTKRILKSEVPVLNLNAFAKDAGLGYIPSEPHKQNYGFQEHIGCEDCLQGLFTDWLGQKQPELLKQSKTNTDGGPNDCYISPYPSEFHQSTFIAGQAEDFIRRRATNTEPWFAFCSFIAPHHPFEAPADQIARYDISSIPLPKNREAGDQHLIPDVARQAFQEMNTWTEEGLRRTILHYFASISLVDENVGHLVKALEATNQLENTIVIFTSDHGEFLGNHGLIRKPSIHYDEVLRVPLLIRLPNRTAGGRREAGLVELVDVHPTVSGLAGLQPNPGVQGIDWSDALQNGGTIGRPDIYSDMYDDPVKPETCMIASGGPYMASQTLRTEKWKLSIYPSASRSFGQLFDIEHDPEELENLYGHPRCRDIREDLLWRLTARLTANIDPLPFVLSQY